MGQGYGGAWACVLYKLFSSDGSVSQERLDLESIALFVGRASHLMFPLPRLQGMVDDWTVAVVEVILLTGSSTPRSSMLNHMDLSLDLFFFVQGAHKGTNLRGFTQIFADFCRFSPFPGKQSIWEAQIFAENCRFSQEPAENRRLAFVPLGSSP